MRKALRLTLVVALACAAGIVYGACQQQCKQVTGSSSGTGMGCNAFSPVTCIANLWVSGGTNNFCFPYSPKETTAMFQCANCADDVCPEQGGNREMTPPANYDDGTTCGKAFSNPARYECSST